ncbi:MAG TPA: HepT-like ribonuclease domain-containing protein [Desulfobaccales bacterium]
MPCKKADAALLWDMLDAAMAIQSFVTGKTFHNYVNERMLRGAVERHLEIIGEAAKGVSKTFQKAHPEISWHRIIAQRHVLAHEYGEIKFELIWRVATLRIPELVEILEPLVPPPPPEEAQ